MKTEAKIVLLILIALVLILYWPAQNFEFVSYDDNIYVTNNSHVQGGLTVEGLIWAFTNMGAGFWHPLTWLSLMLDFELYGLNGGGYHGTNILFHLLNSLLLFLILLRMTDKLWQSGFVAALFAVHPLHVESVAWVAERKDVLSTFFWMLTMGAYVHYLARPSLFRYLGMVVFFILGLMAKPMLVTLPFVLLLLDYWPLNRLKEMDWSVIKRLIAEKTPLFLLAFIFSVLTFYAEGHLGALPSQVDFPIVTRISNAIVVFFAYLGKMFQPVELSFYYPHPGMRPVWQIVLSFMTLTGISVFVMAQARRYPYLPVGWFFYLGTLVPVIGIVQVGGHGMADRYTYIPLIGVFIMIAWGIPEWLGLLFRKTRMILAICAVTVLSILSVLCFSQVKVWQDSVTLFSHAVRVNSNDGKLQQLLGYALMEKGRWEEGIVHFHTAARIDKDDSSSHYNLGAALSRGGKDQEAAQSFLKALQLKPGYGEAYQGLGQAYERLGRFDDARACYEQALMHSKNRFAIYNSLALLLSRMGKYDESEKVYKKAIALWPDHAGLRNNYAMLLKLQGRTEESMSQFRAALRLRDDYANAHYELAIMLSKYGRREEARDHFRRAARINPSYPMPLF